MNIIHVDHIKFIMRTPLKIDPITDIELSMEQLNATFLKSAFNKLMCNASYAIATHKIPKSRLVNFYLTVVAEDEGIWE